MDFQIYQVRYFTLFWIVGHILCDGDEATGVRDKCKELSQESLDNLKKNLTAENSRLHWSFWLLPSLQRAAEENVQPDE